MISLDPRMSPDEMRDNIHVYNVPHYGASVSLEDFKIVLQRLEQAEKTVSIMWIGRKHGVAG